MKRLLVTGGLGFIGSHFIEYMLQHHSHVHIVNLDMMTYAGNPDNLLAITQDDRYQWIKGDITSSSDVEAAFATEIDAVVHFAAESHVDRSIADPQAFAKTNVLGTLVLLEAAKKHGVSKFVHVSTDEVYGTLGSTGYFTETTPLAPNSPYAASKAGSDLLARSYYETYQFPVVITRCSNNYGPRQFPEKLIPTIITKALANEPIPIYGDGRNVRDWLHVRDHCAAVALALQHGVPGEVYNVGGHNEWSNLNLASFILELMNKPYHLLQFVSDRLGHDRRYAIDPTKIQQELGWKPSISFEAGMEDTVNWYLSASTWLDRIHSGEYHIL